MHNCVQELYTRWMTLCNVSVRVVCCKQYSSMTFQRQHQHQCPSLKALFTQQEVPKQCENTVFSHQKLLQHEAAAAATPFRVYALSRFYLFAACVKIKKKIERRPFYFQAHLAILALCEPCIMCRPCASSNLLICTSKWKQDKIVADTVWMRPDPNPSLNPSLTCHIPHQQSLFLSTSCPL